MRQRPTVDQLGEPAFTLDEAEARSRFWSTKTWNRIVGIHEPKALARLRHTYPAYLFEDDRLHIVLNMLTSAPDLDQDESQKKGRWTPVKVLGVGGEGMVGLWALKDSEGQVIDEIAIKESHFYSEQKKQDERENKWEDARLRPLGIEKEAVYHVGLQQKNRNVLANRNLDEGWAMDRESHLIHLRRYRFSELYDSSRSYAYYAPFASE